MRYDVCLFCCIPAMLLSLWLPYKRGIQSDGLIGNTAAEWSSGWSCNRNPGRSISPALARNLAEQQFPFIRDDYTVQNRTEQNNRTVQYSTVHMYIMYNIMSHIKLTYEFARLWQTQYNCYIGYKLQPKQ